MILHLPLFIQDFGFTDIGELQFEDDLCLDVSKKTRGGHIQIFVCHGLGGNQKWEYNNQVTNRREWVLQREGGRKGDLLPL